MLAEPLKYFKIYKIMCAYNIYHEALTKISLRPKLQKLDNKSYQILTGSCSTCPLFITVDIIPL